MSMTIVFKTPDNQTEESVSKYNIMKERKKRKSTHTHACIGIFIWRWKCLSKRSNKKKKRCNEKDKIYLYHQLLFSSNRHEKQNKKGLRCEFAIKQNSEGLVARGRKWKRYIRMAYLHWKSMLFLQKNKTMCRME